MKIRIHETDFDGIPVACTGEFFEGVNATEIVEAMKKNPFHIDLTIEEYMRKILDKIGLHAYTLTEDDAPLEFLNLLAKLNYASFEEQEVKEK